MYQGRVEGGKWDVPIGGGDLGGSGPFQRGFGGGLDCTKRVLGGDLGHPKVGFGGGNWDVPMGGGDLGGSGPFQRDFGGVRTVPREVWGG